MKTTRTSEVPRASLNLESNEEEEGDPGPSNNVKISSNIMEPQPEVPKEVEIGKVYEETVDNFILNGIKLFWISF